ncbi:hypothetical protein DUI87_24683 [Hirundo rustica rustica]|uniref:TOG domain-containing protein n=1 Tax=Hirundo rustica rustica TaxID=333673 RepID=A0A3M0JIA9_HIRRU|nr:hypothetical protein DUI87_24683 [Hirundo rustica rustica]
MAEPPPGAAAPRGRGRAWERGGSAQDAEDSTEPSAHNGSGTEPPGPALNGSGTEPPGPALNGSGTDAPGRIHNGSDTEPPGPAEDGPGTEPSGPAHDDSDTEPSGPTHDDSDTEPSGPAHDDSDTEPSGPAHDDSDTEPSGPAHDDSGTEPPGPAHDDSGTEPPGSREDGSGTEPPGSQEDAAPPAGPELWLVPPELRARLLDRRDYRGRAQAVEQLRRAVESCSPAALGSAPAAALLGLIALLDALLHDPNFAVARGALEVTRLLALRLGRRVPAVLAPLVCAAARALGDAQPAMRRDGARLLLRLMAAAGPRPVLRLLLQERLLRHRSARLREELLNTCIAALLAFPAAELDPPRLAAALAPALLDSKRRVRHAAMEAFAALASAAGPGDTGALLRALDEVELRAGGAGVLSAVRARLARKALPRLGERGLVEYGVPLPCSGRCRGQCRPPGADTEWLLMGGRSRSAHGHGGHTACARRGPSPRRVLSAGRGKNKLPWEKELAADREGGSGVRIPVSEGVEQLAASNDFLHSPKLWPSQGIPGSEELFSCRNRAPRTLFQPSTELNWERSALGAGALGSHQPQIAGKCGTLGYPQARGKSGSVGSDLQFLGLNNSQQDKGKSQEDPRSLSSSWPLKSFEGLPRPGSQKQLLSQKPGDNTGDSPLEKPSLPLEKPSLQEKPSLPLEKHSLPLEKHSLPLERHSLQLEKPSLQLEQEAFPPAGEAFPAAGEAFPAAGEAPQLEKHSLPLERHSLPLEKHSLQLEKHSLQLEKHSLPLERHSLPLEKHSLPLEKHSLQLEKPPLPLEKHSLPLEKHSLPLEKHSLQLEKHSLPLEKHSLQLEKHSLQLEKPPLPLEKHSLQLEKHSLPLEKHPLPLEKPPLPLRAALGRLPAGLRGARPVPPIPRLPGPQEPPEGTELAAGLAELQLQPRELEQEEMQNSLRSLRNSAAKKRAKLSSSIADRESPDSAVKLEFCGDCPSQGSSPGASCTAESGISSRESPCSPLGTLPPRRRVMSDTFPALGSKSHPAKASPARPRDAEGAEHHPSTGPAESVPAFAPKNDLGFTSEDVVVVGKGVFGGPPGPAPRQPMPCVANGDAQGAREGAEPAPGRSFQQSSASHSHGNEGQIKVTLSKSAQEKLRRRRKEDKEHNHKEQQEGKDLEGKEEFPWERIRLSMSEPEKLTAESEDEGFSLCGDLLTSPRNGSLSLENVALNPSLKRTSSLKRSKCSSFLDSAVCPEEARGRCREPVTQSPEVLDPAELQPFPRPEWALAEALALLADHDCHLHSAVRRCTAQHLGDIVERVGPERILAGGRAVPERLLPAIARFAQDSSQQTRYYGRKMLFSMMAHPDLDKSLEKFVPAKDLPYIKETVGSLREKGLGEMPLDTPSAKGRRSQTGNVGHLRSSSTCRDAPIILDRDSAEPQEAPRRAAPRSALESEDYVRDIVSLLNAKDFRERISGVRQLLLDTESSPALVLANIVRIFDAFKPRLHDSNSKVNQVALEAMHKMVPLLKDNLSPVINMLIPAIVDNNLNSKNPGIYTAATNVIQALCQHLDTSLLLQPFCTKAQFLSGKAKQDLTEKLAELVLELYPRKPCAVEQKVLPVLWHLLGASGGGGSVPGPRTAAASLAQALWAQMGPGLLAHAAAQPPHISKSLEELLETGT